MFDLESFKLDALFFNDKLTSGLLSLLEGRYGGKKIG